MKRTISIISELRAMDLNLLVALRALLDERHVSRAAEASGLSQPAMSRALQRLRAMFNDPLLVKSEQGYELTPRALAADLALGKVLSDIQYLIAPPAFDPTTAKGDIRIVALDVELVILLPKIISRLRTEAPGIHLWTIAPKMNVAEGLDFSPLINGDIHLILTAFQIKHSGIYQQKLFDERNICITAPGHPDARQTFSGERFMQRDHVWVNIIGPDPGQINQTLSKHGLARRTKVSVPGFLLAAYMVATTELISIIPYRVVLPFLEKSLVVPIETPFEFPSFNINQYWHERYNKDPQHIWFRKLVLEVARAQG